MRAYCLLIWVLLEQTQAYEHILYVNGIQEESVIISCQSKQQNAQPAGFHLFREAAAPGERESVASLLESKVTSYTNYEGRIKISAQPSLNIVNVTLLNVKTTDSGLYNCVFTTREHQKEMVDHALILLKIMDGDCSCTGHYSVIYAIAVAVLLLFLILITLCTAYHRKVSSHDKYAPVIPIYEPMSTVQPTCEPSNPFTAQTDPTTAEPVYALPRKGETQECHYEIPKKLTSNALKQEVNPELTAEIDENN